MKLRVFIYVLFLMVLASAMVFARGNAEVTESPQAESDHSEETVDSDNEHTHEGHDHSEDRVDLDENVGSLSTGFKEVSGNGFVFRWRIVDDTIEFTIQAPTTGWVAVGFKPTVMMRDADFVLAYIDDGDIFISDDYGVSTIGHRPDNTLGGTDDYTILGGNEASGSTTIQLSRPLDTGDEYDQPLQSGEELRIIYAWGGNGVDNFTTRHSRRGGITLTL